MTKQPQRAANADPKTNRLLAGLETEDYDALMREAKVVSLKFRKRLLRQDAAIDAVYFPITSMISLLVTTDGQPQMEMGTIGKEGVVGASEVFQKQGAMGLNLVQIPGTAVRIDAEALRKLNTSRPAIKQVVDQHLFALMRQILHGAACNRIHSMEERCARWLLIDPRPGGRGHLSANAGVSFSYARRAALNVATGMLKKAGFIRYVRGRLTVVDRPGLESASCECYQAIIRVYDSLLPSLPKKKS